MSANANIRITGTTKGLQTAYKEAVVATNDLTSNFKAKATEISAFGGKIGALQDKLARFNNQKSFQQGIIGDFHKLNDQLLVAEGRQALFGDSMAANRAKASAYTSALNSLLAKGLHPTSEEAQGLANKIKQLDGEFSRTQSVQAFGSKLRGVAINGALVLSAALLGVAGASLKAYAEFDGLSRGLQTVEGSAINADKRINGVLSSLAKMPGLGLQEVIKGDIALRNQGFSAGGSARIQAAFGNAIATSGGGKENFNQIIAQLGQMAAKGKVLAEDLKPIITQAPVVAKALRTLFGTVSSEDISKALQAKGQDSRQFIAMLVGELEKAEKVTGGFKNELENADDALFQLKAEMGKSIDKNTGLTESLRKTNELMVLLKKPAADWTGTLLNGLTEVAKFAAKTFIPVLGPIGNIFSVLSADEAKNNKLDAFKKESLGMRSARIEMMKEENAELKKQIAYENQFAFSSRKSGLESKLAENEAALKSYQKANLEARKEARRSANAGAFDWGNFGPGGNKDGNTKAGLTEFSKKYKEVVKIMEEAADAAERARARFINATNFDTKPTSGAGISQQTGNSIFDFKDKDKTVFGLPSAESMREKINRTLDSYNGLANETKSKVASIAESFGGPLANAFTGFGQAIATLSKSKGNRENPFKAFGEGLLQSFGDMLIQVGQKMLIEAGVVLAGSLLGGPAGVALGAAFYKSLAVGGALTVAGGALRSVKLAKGGLANGPTMALVGEGKGTNAFRPEVISPLPKLLGIISQAFAPVLRNYSGGGRQGYQLQPLVIHTYQYTDGRQTGRSVQRANYRSSKINP